MINIRPALNVTGLVMCIVALLMCIPASIDFFLGANDWLAFIIAAAATGFIGGSLTLANYSKNFSFNIKEAFIITLMTWVATALCASIPFFLSTSNLSFTDAVFEATSGITTTGSTIMVNLDNLTPGFLIWRAILQWLGGLGFIVTAIAVFPLLKIGGMQLFKLEASDNYAKALPKTAQIATWISIFYLFFTVVCALLLAIFGMTVLEAITHAMSTIATGGFSTADESIAKFDSWIIEIIIMIFMIIGSLPFFLYIRAYQGDKKLLFSDSQVVCFISIIIVAIIAITLWRWQQTDMPLLNILRQVSFNSISLITGTGFTTQDVTAWGGFAVTMLMFLMALGGCSGSTTCGIKIFRLQVIWSTVRYNIMRLIRPRGIFIAHYGNRVVSSEISESVIVFLCLFFSLLFLVALGLSLSGFDFNTSVAIALTALANVGPALGSELGAQDNFSELNNQVKWLMSAAMITGRLEFFTVIVLLSPSFWRN